MKRIAVKLLLFLLLGAIINVAVAWGVVYWTNPVWAGDRIPTDRDLAWVSRLGIQITGVSYVGTSFGAGVTEDYLYQIDESNQPQMTACCVHSGFPAKSMAGYFRLNIKNWTWSPMGGIVRESKRNTIFIPLLPTWPGFAINTIIYAALVWSLASIRFIPTKLRGRLRLKRGLCPKCAYPLGAGDTCTECGGPIRGPALRRKRADGP